MNSNNHTSGTQLIDMSLGLLSATESTIVNHKDYYYNMNEWKKEKDKNVLYITGLSGSGKSTLGKKISQDNNAEYIDSDIFLSCMREDHYKWSNKDTFMKKMIDEFYSNPRFNISKEEYGKLTEYDAYKLYQDILDWIYKYLSKYPSKLFVFEGVWVYLYFDFEYLKNKPLIIKGTSAHTSFNRAKRREAYVPENSRDQKKEYAGVKANDLELSKLINYMDSHAVKTKSFNIK